jgi:hypothetical protein
MTAMQTLTHAEDTDAWVNVSAMFNVGVLLGQLGRSEEAAGVYDQLVARFGDATEPALREQVAAALRMKVEMKGHSGGAAGSD